MRNGFYRDKPTLIRAPRTFSRKREKALATSFIAAPSPATAGEGGRRPGEGVFIAAHADNHGGS